MTASAPRDELADLRRRAYGPDGDPDGADLDRLQQLEDALRRAADAEESPDTGVAAAGGQPDDGGAPAGAPPTVSTAENGAPARAPREPLRRTLRRRRVLLVLVAVALLAGVAAAAWLVSRPGADVLRRVALNDTAAQERLAGSLRNYGLDPDSYVQFESFEGLEVWTARIPDRGLRCLLVVNPDGTTRAFNGLVDYSCTPEGLVPSVDIVQLAVDGELGDRPVGSVARLVFRGDRVETTVVDARGRPDLSTPAPR